MFIYPKFSIASNLIGIILYLIQVTLHIFLLLVNPGIPNRKFYISEGVMQSILTYLEYTKSETFDKYKICKICNIYVTPDSVVTHCEDCNICIQGKFISFEDMNHHCNELGKCVSKRHIGMFNMFVLFTMFYLIYSIVCYIVFVCNKLF